MTRPNTDSLKQRVHDFWDAHPCGTRDLQEQLGTPGFFQHLEAQRDLLDPHIPPFARFEAWKGMKVLEVGFGAGVDFVRFARAGAELSGIDLTEAGKALVDRWLELEHLSASTQTGDAEHLPFPANTFDLVYSWGVIHHTTDTPAAAREIIRVTKPGGEVRVMIYHSPSLVALQAYLLYGLLWGRPFRSMDEILARHVESPGTKAYTIREARELFADLDGLEVVPRITTYDLRFPVTSTGPGVELFVRLGRILRNTLPQRWGWNLLIHGRKL
jgi:SAM-dependent methyltransferase